jgi:hypothetical protein
MLLSGSCHCGKVSFKLVSRHPYPFNICYCEICRKTAGGGGYAVNLGGEASSLDVEGEKYLSIYKATLVDKDVGPYVSSAERNFCKACGSALWLWDPAWPELIHPFASAIDSELPSTPEKTHLMTAYKASWVTIANGKEDQLFLEYPDESIADWHKRLGLEK